MGISFINKGNGYTKTEIDNLLEEKVNNDIFYDQIPTETIEGDSIIINDSSNLPVENIMIKGQNKYIGKNVFDGLLELGQYNSANGSKMSDNALYRNVNPVKVKANTTYTMSINGVAQQYVMFFYDKTQTFLSHADNRTGTFTTPDNTGYLCFRCYAADFTSDFANLKVQIEEGSTATSYVTYLPNENYPQDIHRVTGDCSIITNSNLFDKNTITNNYYYDTSGNYTAISDTYVSDFIEVQPNEYYVIKTNPDPSNRRINFFNKNKEWNGQIAITSNNYIFEIPSNIEYIRISFYKAISLSQVQVQAENQSITYPLTLGNIELLTEEYPYKNADNWYIHKEYEKIASYNGETITTDYISTTGTLSTGATVYYKSPSEILISDTTLIAQLEALKNIKTYKNTTSINTTGDDLPPKVRMVYRQDIDTMFENI